MNSQTPPSSSKETHLPIDVLVSTWDAALGSDPELRRIEQLLDFLSQELYGDYEPYAEWPVFMERLGAWVQNVDNEAHQQTLFRMVPWLLFFGKEDMKTMYRAAFAGPITQWIIEKAAIPLGTADLDTRFDAAVAETWFGSMAGMDIGSFMRLNGISEQNLRPEFRVLSHLGDPQRIRDHLRTPDAIRPNGYRRIVVVEDVVGSGRQMKDAVRILDELTEFEVLLCPIIVAKAGCETGEMITQKNAKHMTFSPHYRIPEAATLEPVPTSAEEPTHFNAARELVNQTWDRLKLPKQYDKPFGIGNLGLLVLTYLNCPNNVPPLFHRMTEPTESSLGWFPLFPRVVRET